MKKIVTIALFGFVLYFTGCEVSDNGTITVIPDKITLVPGESYQFTLDPPLEYIVWSLEGTTGISRIHRDSGLLTVGNNEAPKTFTIIASEKNFYSSNSTIFRSYHSDGKATVIVANPDPDS